MKHHFEYRIGKSAQHSQEQWHAAVGETVAESIESLKTVEPAQWLFEVFAVIVNELDEVVRTSKYSCPVLQCNSGMEMYLELQKYNKAAELPIFNRDKFNCYDYLVINSEDLSREIIQETIKELDGEVK